MCDYTDHRLFNQQFWWRIRQRLQLQQRVRFVGVAGDLRVRLWQRINNRELSVRPVLVRAVKRRCRLLQEYLNHRLSVRPVVEWHLVPVNDERRWERYQLWL